jgi:hypothetical protein
MAPYRSDLLRLRFTLHLIFLLIDCTQQEEDLSDDNFGERLLALKWYRCGVVGDG